MRRPSSVNNHRLSGVLEQSEVAARSWLDVLLPLMPTQDPFDCHSSARAAVPRTSRLRVADRAQNEERLNMRTLQGQGAQWLAGLAQLRGLSVLLTAFGPQSRNNCYSDQRAAP